MPLEKPTSNKHYTVTFDANGGTLSDVETSYSPKFEYWYDSAGNKYYSGQNAVFKSSTTLYAHYSQPQLYASHRQKPMFTLTVGMIQKKKTVTTSQKVINTQAEIHT